MRAVSVLELWTFLSRRQLTSAPGSGRASGQGAMPPGPSLAGRGADSAAHRLHFHSVQVRPSAAGPAAAPPLARLVGRLVTARACRGDPRSRSRFLDQGRPHCDRHLFFCGRLFALGEAWCVGWVERSETHHVRAMGFAALYPSYPAPCLVAAACFPFGPPYDPAARRFMRVEVVMRRALRFAQAGGSTWSRQSGYTRSGAPKF